KIKAGIPGDIERIRRIRELLPEVLIRVDANQGWSLKEAPGKIAALERLGVECIEEPSAGTPRELEELARKADVPIILDESVRDIDHLRRYIAEAPSISGIVVKIAKTGGPAAALSLINAARYAGLQIMLSSMVESSLGIGAALPLAPLCTWIDLDAPLLLADNPFTGLSYPDEIPTIRAGGLQLSPELNSFIETLPPFYEE
ncbi:MAG: dipeptide epimerase, partial [Spirochaetes bacterium]|nr:dipeptide epimerase [Spirochaetota bacterium]